MKQPLNSVTMNVHKTSESPGKALTTAPETTESERARRQPEEPSAPGFLGLTSPFLLSAALIFVAARLWQLTSYGLFGDEVFTLWTAAQDWRSLFSSVVGDVVHPPLFYVLLKVWIAIGGQSLLWLKLLPALTSIVSLVPFVLLCRELKIDRAAMALALWLMAVNGFLITHSQELRMYSLLLSLTICSLWLFAKLINRDSKLQGIEIAFFVVNLLLVFTHYYGWVVVALEMVAVLIWKRERLRSFATGTVFLALCFSPWVYLVSHAARDNPGRINFVWNQPPPLSELIGFYGNLNGPLSYRWRVFGTALVLFVFLSPVVAWASRAGKERQDRREFLWLAMFAAGPVALAFLASHLLPQPVWAFRYLIIAAPAYFLIVAIAAHRLRPNQGRIGAFILIAGWAGLSGFTEMINRDRIAWEPLVRRMIQAENDYGAGIPGDARSPVAGRPSPVPVYVTDANVGNTIQFYLDQAGDSRFQVTAVNNLTSFTDAHCWLAFIRYKHENQVPLQDVLGKGAYSVGAMIESETTGDRAVLLPVWRH